MIWGKNSLDFVAYLAQGNRVIITITADCWNTVVDTKKNAHQTAHTLLVLLIETATAVVVMDDVLALASENFVWTIPTAARVSTAALLVQEMLL